MHLKGKAGDKLTIPKAGSSFFRRLSGGGGGGVTSPPALKTVWTITVLYPISENSFWFKEKIEISPILLQWW